MYFLCYSASILFLTVLTIRVITDLTTAFAASAKGFGSLQLYPASPSLDWIPAIVSCWTFSYLSIIAVIAVKLISTLTRNLRTNAGMISNFAEAFPRWTTICLMKPCSRRSSFERGFSRNVIDWKLLSNAFFLNLWHRHRLSPVLLSRHYTLNAELQPAFSTLHSEYMLRIFQELI